MSEDTSTPIPDEPGQDPESPQLEPHTDGYGFSDTEDAGYELDGPAGEPTQEPTDRPLDDV